jgi:exonuclease V gamma subunit
LCHPITSVDHPHLFTSPRLEWLYEQLRDQSLAGGPFSHRWLIVPTKAIKGWLQQQFATDPSVGVFAGFETLFLEEAVSEANLSRGELALRIEVALRDNPNEFAHVLRYDHPRKLRERRIRLAWQLADLFRDYAIYGMEKKGWQYEFFKRLPKISTKRELPDQIHLFGFAYIPPKFLHELSKFPVRIYSLTPSSEYWGESDDPLLSGLGQLGQMQYRLLDELPSTEDSVGQFAMPQVEVHAAPSRWREVELLCSWLGDREPGDVVVMAPDIEPYVPFIRAVFEAEGVPYRIEEIARPETGSVAEGFEHLLDLAEGRWEASSVMALLEHPTQRVKFSAEELRQIRLWIEESGIRWGRDGVHRKEVLEAEPLDREGHSWKQGLEKLLTVPLGLTDLFERFLTLIDSLMTDLAPLSDVEMSLPEWAGYFSCLVESYLEGELPFGDLQMRVEGQFSLPMVRRLLVGRSTHGIGTSDLNAVRFGSLLSLRALPAKVVAVLGLDGDSFPRSSRPNLLDQTLPGRPTPQTTDRYLLLEALLSCRERFFASYTSLNGSDGLPQPPAIPLQLLGVEPIHHLPVALDETAESYRRSLARFGAERVAPKIFMPFELDEVELPAVMELWELELAVRDPLRLYARHTLGINRVDELELQDEEPLVPDRFQELVWRGLTEPIEALTEGMPFRSVFERRLKREVKQLRRALERHGVVPEEIHNLSLSEGIEEAIDGVRPPLNVDGVQLVGELRRLSPGGLVVQGKGDGAAYVRAYPSLLVASALNLADRVVWSGSVKGATLECDAMAGLKALIQFAQQCKKAPCPLSASWLSHLTKGTPATPILSPYGSWLGVSHISEDWKSVAGKLFSLHPDSNF